MAARFRSPNCLPLKLLSVYYLTVPVQFLLNLIFVAGCLLHFRRLRHMLLLLVYAIFALLQTAAGLYVNAFAKDHQAAAALLEHSVNIFGLIEFICFCLYIHTALVFRVPRLLLLLLCIIMTGWMLMHWLLSGSFESTPYHLMSLEAYLIILASLCYYFEIFYRPVVLNLAREPRFWVITGMMFLSILLTPLFLQNLHEPGMPSLTKLYALTFIGYILFFIFLIHALKCQIQVEKP